MLKFIIQVFGSLSFFFLDNPVYFDDSAVTIVVLETEFKFYTCIALITSLVIRLFIFV